MDTLAEPELEKPSTTRAIMRNSPNAVAGVALFGYILIFAIFISYFGDLRDFIVIGKPYITQSQISSAIRVDPAYDYEKNGVGYDGQFAYYIALDPVNARYYLDQGFVTYRYSRILYPVVARTLAVGNPDWVPATMVIVNLLAVVLGTWAVAAWCQLKGLSPWLALIYAFYVGQVMAFVRSLNEPLAYALIALAIYLFTRFPRHRLFTAVLFALAALAREATLIFAALYGLSILLESEIERPFIIRARLTLLFWLVAFTPAILWQVFLIQWLGSAGWGQGASLLRIPFSGLYSLYPLGPDTLQVVEVVLVPGLLCVGICATALWKQRIMRRQIELWALILNFVLLVALLYPDPLEKLYAAGRISLPVTLCAIYCMAFIKSRWWLALCSGLWLTATVAYLINPILELTHRVFG